MTSDARLKSAGGYRRAWVTTAFGKIQFQELGRRVPLEDQHFFQRPTGRNFRRCPSPS
ncbi:hypothetical protein WN55_09886 [Dufourea novaeangliae]|uniref:Uncharacterized protein n=1 Tax=Dufourea novaeangliae TaxID=178035 RepID=A0A154P791_DUFNO|nr:hypothetical protein WN55_09886 [Dufourea novaeangliae]